MSSPSTGAIRARRRDSGIPRDILDSLRQASDDPILARLHLGQVNRRSAGWYRDPPLPGVPDDLECVRMLEQRLGRNTPPDQAGPAEGFLFLDTNRQPHIDEGLLGGHKANTSFAQR